MEPLTEEQQKIYDAELAAYQACGHFANRQIAAFKPFVKDGVLDEEGVMKQWGLNERQIPFLKIELEAAGYLVELESQAESAKPDLPKPGITFSIDSSAKATKPLPKIEE